MCLFSRIIHRKIKYTVPTLCARREKEMKSIPIIVLKSKLKEDRYLVASIVESEEYKKIMLPIFG